MDTTAINHTELIPMLGVQLRKAGAYHVGACPFCGGVDRFTVKHTPQGDKWHCRNCGDDKYHDVIEFIMRRDGIGFIEACRLSGAELYRAGEITTKIQPAQPKAPQVPDEATQARMIGAMDKASERLLTPAGSAVQQYLTARGITLGSWYAWHLGAANVYDPKAGRKRPALSIPWYYIDAQREVITAIKYRFIDEDPNGLRYTSAPGSIPVLYGLWDAQKTDKTLLLVEGEINALSLWQCRPQDTTVLSIGSDSGGREDVLQTLANLYQYVFIWCDDPARTAKYKAMITKPAKGLQSPIIEGRKIDANNLLQAGKLCDFIRHVLKVNCEGNTKKN